MENNLVIQMFEIYCIFLVVYGFKLRIWKQSRTTEWIILYASISAGIKITEPIHHISISLTGYLVSSSVFLLFLFIKAVLKTDERKGET